MSRRQSGATERAVNEYRWANKRHKNTKKKRRAFAKRIAAHHGVHRTTLYRALGFYRKATNAG